ncbi:MAG: Crp/Fnr family transcriptional regulator, partial [Myxococcales bacterium]
GDRLLAQGKVPEAISLIVGGRVQVKADGQVLGELGPGDVAGSAIILTGAAANVDAVALDLVRSVRWDVKTLESYLSANPETRIVLQQHLARDLAGKVQRLMGDRGSTPAAGTAAQPPGTGG